MTQSERKFRTYQQIDFLINGNSLTTLRHPPDSHVKDMKDKEKWNKHIRYVLLPAMYSLELFASAVNEEVYDYDVVERVCRDFLISIRDDHYFCYYLDHLRKDAQNRGKPQGVLKQLDTLIDRLRKDQEQASD